MRRSHRKSRHGCKECKQRHAKCDESRPVCGGCATAKRHCSYLNSGPALPVVPPQALPSPAQSAFHVSPEPSFSSTTSHGLSPSAHLPPFDSTTATRQSPAANPETTSTPPSRLQYPLSPASNSEHDYSILHLQLLHHLEHDFSTAMGPEAPVVSRVLQMALVEAFTAPFLMDELLALSAVHQSTLADEASPHHRVAYRTEATRLQTRALARYNTVVSGQDLAKFNLAIFLFSTFLGQHVLFDTFSLLHTSSCSTTTTSNNHNLAEVLDRLVHCLGLHRGIAAVAGGAWPALMAELRDRLGPDAEHFDPESHANHNSTDDTTLGPECADLMARLADKNGGSELSTTSREACRGAVAALQRVFDVQRSWHAGKGDITWNQRFIGVQEWPVRISADYINLLSRRQPEALVILAHYAVVLHHARGHWIVGDVGDALVRSISSHLGGYWADWLEWPNRVILENTAWGLADE